MKKIIFVIGIVLASASSSQAQLLHDMYAISWEVSFPLGKSFVSNTSWAGGKLEFRRFLKDNFSLGGTLSWNNYREYRPRETYENADQTQAVTTDNERFIFNLPVTVDGFYYLKKMGRVKPFVGIGLGAQYSSQEAYFNIFVIEDKNWGFVARPQIGAFIPFSDFNRNGVLVSVGYNYATNQNESFRINNMQSFWFSIGVGFTD